MGNEVIPKGLNSSGSGLKYNPKTGLYEAVDAAGIATAGGQKVSPYTSPDTNAAYSSFKSTNTPVTDAGASGLASGLMNNYGNVGYSAKTAKDYIPQEVLGQLGKATSSLTNYTPEKIDVSKVQTMPVEYYQSQIEDLSKPLVDQYNLAREKSRGDQAARGTMYDSEGYKDIGQLDKSYLDQLGNITRGVQQTRMQNENANAQDYATRADTEALNRRSMGLEGLTAGGNLVSGVAGMYGDLGGKESERAVTTALQNKGLDANTINSLLGYGADRYGTEANLFGNIYGQDTTYNTAMMEDARTREQNRRQSIIDQLDLTGYTDQPQGQLWNALSGELGYPLTDLQNQAITEAEGQGVKVLDNQGGLQIGLPVAVRMKPGETARASNGNTYVWNGSQWTMLA